MFELFDLVFLYTFFSKFTKWFRICLKESVPTVSSAAMAVYIFFVWHGKNKDQRENKTTILSSCFLLLLSRWAFIHVACRINFLRMRAISYCLLSIAEKWDGSNNSNSFLALIVKSGNKFQALLWFWSNDNMRSVCWILVEDFYYCYLSSKVWETTHQIWFLIATGW